MILLFITSNFGAVLGCLLGMNIFSQKLLSQLTKIELICSVGHATVLGLPRDLRRGVGLQRAAHHGLPQLRVLQVQPQVFHPGDGGDGRYHRRPIRPQEKYDPAGMNQTCKLVGLVQAAIP